VLSPHRRDFSNHLAAYHLGWLSNNFVRLSPTDGSRVSHKRPALLLCV
jgi:hypothetical protein